MKDHLKIILLTCLKTPENNNEEKNKKNRPGKNETLKKDMFLSCFRNGAFSNKAKTSF